MSLVLHLLQSTLVAGGVVLLALALRRGPGRVRYGLWLFASAKFLVPLAPLVAAGGALTAWSGAAPFPAALTWLDQSLSLAAFAAAASPDRTGIPGPAGWLLVVVAVVWAAGAATIAFRQWRAWRDVCRLVRASTPLGPGREADALRRVCARTGVVRPIALLESTAPIEPGVAGVLSPALLWPTGLSARLSDEEIEAIVAHEVCHVVRRDNLGALLQMVVEAVFWFHPLVWYIGARMAGERERACDEEVVRMGTNERRYAEAILKVCGFCLRTPMAHMAGIGVSDLTRRIERIMCVRPAAPSLRTRLILPLVLIVTAVIPIAAGCAAAVRGTAQSFDEVPRAGDGVTVPSIVSQARPSYTAEAMGRRIQGTVELEAVVLETGVVGEIRVARSLDAEYGLDEEAIAALRQWRFQPGTRDGTPVPVRIEVSFSFSLRSSR